MMKQVPAESFKNFFSNYKSQIDFSRVSLFICRADGVMLHAFSQQGANQLSSIGALLAGVWQAAGALADFIPNRRDALEFRLGFDSSAEGVYILPLKSKRQPLYLAAIYHGIVNPGLLKNQLRQLEEQLSRFIDDLPLAEEVEAKKFLFEKITNDEIDQLFSFVGRK